jgi:hypothetical protein
MNLAKKYYFGKDAEGKYFCILKVAEYIKIQYNKEAAVLPLGYNIRIECPIKLGQHTATINALVNEFRESFAFDALVVFNVDHNAFYFDFS